MPIVNDDNELFWVIPEAINLPQILRDNPPTDFKPIPDHFYFILDYLQEQMEFTDLDETEGYINLNSAILQQNNRQYNLYLRYLTQRRILRTDGRAIKGKKSTGYAIRPEYLSDKTIQIQIDNFIIRRKVKKTIAQKAKQKAVTEKKYLYLTRWFNPNLKIDVQAALREVERLFPKKRKKKKSGIQGRRRGEERITDKRTKRYKAIQAIRKVATCEFYYSVDENIGRFHSNLTNIKKDLRKFLTYDGHPLVTIDISNAQPLLSGVLLQKEFYEGAGELSWHAIKSLKKLFANSIDYSRVAPECATYIILVKTRGMQARREFRQYLRMVQKGTFYRRAYKKMFPGKRYNKEKIKKAMLMAFFSRNQFIGQPRAYEKKQFALTFPHVYEIFKILKRKNHTTLSHLLQRIESHIMIERVARRISSERPGLPIFTIHDSILTILGEEAYIQSVIKEEIWSATSLKANIRIE